MTNPTKKISRRDSMKLLGAAIGAAALANLPTKWNTPQLVAGVLPAHAQTSTSCLVLNISATFLNNINSTAVVSTFPASTPVNITLTATGSGTINGSNPYINNALSSDAGGSLNFPFDPENFMAGDTLTLSCSVNFIMSGISYSCIIYNVT